MLPDTQCFGPLDLSLNTRDDIAKAYSYSAIMLELASASVPPCVRDFVVKQSYLPRQRFRTPCLASIASISCIYDLLCFQSLFIFLSLTHCNKTLVYRSFPFLHFSTSVPSAQSIFNHLPPPTRCNSHQPSSYFSQQPSQPPPSLHFLPPASSPENQQAQTSIRKQSLAPSATTQPSHLTLTTPMSHF